jgi:hypothetical protein
MSVVVKSSASSGPMPPISRSAVADVLVDERSHDPAQIIALGHVIGVELGDDVVFAISPGVVEEREIALLAARPPWPRGLVVGLDPLARGDPNAALLAPRPRLRRHALVGQPHVVGVWEVLREHRLERRAHDRPWLTGGLRHDHRRPQVRDGELGVRALHAPQPPVQPDRKDDELDAERHRVEHDARRRGPMLRLDPPADRRRRGQRPDEDESQERQALARRQEVAEMAVVPEAAPKGAAPVEPVALPCLRTGRDGGLRDDVGVADSQIDARLHQQTR